jgi:hypothetical protein
MPYGFVHHICSNARESANGRERRHVELRILRYRRCILLVHAPDSNILGQSMVDCRGD